MLTIDYEFTNAIRSQNYCLGVTRTTFFVKYKYRDRISKRGI